MIYAQNGYLAYTTEYVSTAVPVPKKKVVHKNRRKNREWDLYAFSNKSHSLFFRLFLCTTFFLGTGTAVDTYSVVQVR